MVIKVIGSGCRNCKKLLQTTEDAVKELGIDAEILYVTDMDEIVATGILKTPGLMIDGEMKASGRVPKAKEVVQMIKEAQ